MKKYPTVKQAVRDLSAKGYTLNYQHPRPETKEFLKSHSLNHGNDDFFIDEIYRCEEVSTTNGQEVTFVFAISSRKYQLRCIALNAVKQERAEQTELLKRIKAAFPNMKKYIWKK